MSYLNLLALRRQDPAAVAVLAPKAIEAANEASRPQYAAMAKASLVWLAWWTGHPGKVERKSAGCPRIVAGHQLATVPLDLPMASSQFA
jgi:hypothetical protein